MNNLLKNKKILVAPLNWGLGHATRCIPIIKELEQQGYEPVIASDGSSLNLLQNEFPHLKHHKLPAYDISYSKKGFLLKLKLLSQLPKIYSAISKERKATSAIIKKENIEGIISDNRPGVFSKDIPSVYITHQLNVLSDSLTPISSFLHQSQIKKFSACWVPDCNNGNNLSGKLGHSSKKLKHLSYIGLLSRLTEKETENKYDVAVVLSGPEPQRTLLEKKLKKEFKNYTKPVLFVNGVVEAEQKTWQKGSITFYNYMTTPQLEEALNQSNKVISRSGYSTIMDLACLKKKAFFIPTPGQDEQEYLAKRLKHYGYAPYCHQDNFNTSKLEELNLYKGLSKFSEETTNWNELFGLF